MRSMPTPARTRSADRVARTTCTPAGERAGTAGVSMGPMPRRDRHLLLGLAALTMALAASTLVGVPSDALMALPLLLFATPLLAGRYIGEERLARMAAAFVSRRRRVSSRLLAPIARRVPRMLPRGGRLIAAALAVRPPPALHVIA